MSNVAYDIQGFSCHQLELKEEEISTLQDDCKKAFQVKECQEGERYSSGQTFWLGAKDSPTCALERIAAAIFSLHTSHLQFDEENSGAEWWTQHIASIDDIGFHFDRDYGLEEDGELCHPHLGTVTYLSTVGGATVILDMPGKDYPVDKAGHVDCPLHRCIISRPAIGKHITFNGLMLHGAPADLYEEQVPSDSEGESSDEEEEDECEQPRVTLLVNIWLNHTPSQAVRLDGKVASAMSNSVANVIPASIKFVKCPNDCVKTVSIAQKASHCSKWEVDIESDSCVVSVNLPMKDDLEEFFDGSSHSVVLELSNGDSFVKSIGEAASGDLASNDMLSCRNRDEENDFQQKKARHS